MKSIISFFLVFTCFFAFGQDSIEQIQIESINNLNEVIAMVSEQVNELPKGQGAIGWFNWVLSSCAIIFNILVWLGIAKYYKNKNVQYLL